MPSSEVLKQISTLTKLHQIKVIIGFGPSFNFLAIYNLVFGFGNNIKFFKQFKHILMSQLWKHFELMVHFNKFILHSCHVILVNTFNRYNFSGEFVKTKWNFADGTVSYHTAESVEGITN